MPVIQERQKLAAEIIAIVPVLNFEIVDLFCNTKNVTIAIMKEAKHVTIGLSP